MRIVVMTNTYLPHVGGVAQSIYRFVSAYEKRGHKVLIVAPEFPGTPEHEEDIIRLPALQQFNGSDFSVALPSPTGLSTRLEEFQPDVIHSHHPFLLGDTALRLAANLQTPLVFTHHTMYEQYTHYVPLGAARLGELVISLVTGYANRCDHVIAPSLSVAHILRKRAVRSPITVIPTGVDIEKFSQGDGRRARQLHGIGPDAFVVGHVGRLAPEKNLEFLARSVAAFLREHDDAVFLLVGEGPSRSEIASVFEEFGMNDRLYVAGKQNSEDLINHYHAMDVFVFSSRSETQGMVVTEAMATGLPVIALDATGVREVVVDGENGRLLEEASEEQFADAIGALYAAPEDERRRLCEAAKKTAEEFGTDRCAQKALELYEQVVAEYGVSHEFDDSSWGSLLRTVQEEWRLWSERVSAATAVLREEGTSSAAAMEGESS